jgi:hypothetical protein
VNSQTNSQGLKLAHYQLPKKMGEKTSAAPIRPTTNFPRWRSRLREQPPQHRDCPPVDVDCLQTLQDWENSWPKKTSLSLASLSRLKKVLRRGEQGEIDLLAASVERAVKDQAYQWLIDQEWKSLALGSDSQESATSRREHRPKENRWADKDQRMLTVNAKISSKERVSPFAPASSKQTGSMVHFTPRAANFLNDVPEVDVPEVARLCWATDQPVQRRMMALAAPRVQDASDFWTVS